MSALHLAGCFILSSIMIMAIMLVRKIFNKHLAPKWQYNIWFLLPISLLLPFLPLQLGNVAGRQSFNGGVIGQLQPADTAVESPVNGQGNWMQDFSTSVNRFDTSFLDTALTFGWIAGMAFLSVFIIISWAKLRRIKKSALPLTDREVLSLFIHCKKRLNISRSLVLAESPMVDSPLTFGIVKTYIILPRHSEALLSEEQWKHILLHELHHFKYRDIITNYLIVLFQVLYWYNPLVWKAFREMRLDREIACDSAVLHVLEKKEHAAYGNTIITFADKSLLSKRFAIANQLASPKKQLKKRIKRIAAFTYETRLLNLKSILIFMLLGGVVACQVPVISAMSYGEDHIDFKDGETEYEDLSAYFRGYEGSFVLYDLQRAEYDIYNKEKSTLRVSPNSTYKIYSALFALESEVISQSDNSMDWDGKEHAHQAWNKDQNLSTAMESSATWYFQQLDKKLQKKNIASYLAQIQYGNQDVSGGIENYWLQSSLEISPIEQVQTLQAFYTNQFGFEEENIQFVKDSIKLESKNNTALFGKTGTGTVNGDDVNGWFIGYVETETNTYFFAANIESGHDATGSKAAEITKMILQDKGIY